MKNRILIPIYGVLLAVSVLGFTFDSDPNMLVPNPNVLVNERVAQKATFDYNEGLYNSKANTEMRAKNLVYKDQAAQKQEKRADKEMQSETTGQVLFRF